MKFFKVFLVTCAALVEPSLLATAEGAGQTTTSTAYDGKAAKVNCLSAFNEARTAAGLVPFTQGSGVVWSKDGAETAKLACEAIMEEKKVDKSDTFNSTVALAIQDGDTADCAAAVTHFNGALANFGSLPPAFNASTEVYKSLQAVSFVALYNPKDSPMLDCGYFNCTKTVTTKKDDTTQATDVTNKKGLLCSSSPLALITGQEPFEQKQFDKIKAAINSASAAVPALFTFAVAAAGLALV